MEKSKIKAKTTSPQMEVIYPLRPTFTKKNAAGKVKIQPQDE